MTPMPEPYDPRGREPQEVTDIETARLALRGAVESLRSLQEVNSRLKGEIQDSGNRNKVLEQRLLSLQTELNAVNAKLGKQDEIYNQREETLRRSIRQDVALEENQRWQAEFASLRQSVEMWKFAREQKETELSRIKEVLTQKESEVLDLQKEKVVIQGKANSEMAATLAKFRSELKAAVEAIIIEKDKQLDLQKTQLLEEKHELELRLQAKEAEAQRKDEGIAKRFHDRQKELSEFWAKREQEIWDRAKQAKDTMEAGLKERWESRLKDLTAEYETKTALIKQQFANQQAELQLKDQDLHAEIQRLEDSLNENFTKKANALEQSHIERTSALEMQWQAKEKELTDVHRQALDTERTKLTDELRKAREEMSRWQVTRDNEFHAKEAELRQRHQTLEKDLRDAWGKREEETTLRHAGEIQKNQDALYETLREKLSAASDEYTKQLQSLQLHIANEEKKRQELETELKGLQDRFADTDKERRVLTETLQERETLLHQQMDTKEREWAAANEALREQLSALTTESVRRSEAHLSRIANLEKRYEDQGTEFKNLQENHVKLERERAKVASLLQTRETALRVELEEKQLEWKGVNDALQAQLSQVVGDTTQAKEAHLVRIADLERQSLEAQTQVKILQQKLQGLEKERAVLVENLQAQEAAFRKQLEDREREWTSLNGNLREQLSALSRETSTKIESLQTWVTNLEKQKTEVTAHALALETELQSTERARAELAETLKTREAALRKELEVKGKEWQGVQDALQAQLDQVTADSAKKSESQQARISILDSQNLEAQSEAKILQQKLHHLEQERLKLIETLQVRETELHKEFEEKHRQWIAAQEALQLELSTVTKNSTQKQEAYQAQLNDLERLNAEAKAHLTALQLRLQGLDKERASLLETLADREAGYQKQLRDNEQTWINANDVLRQQLAAQSKEAMFKTEAQRAQIVDLEKQGTEAQERIKQLQKSLNDLMTDKAAAYEIFKTREAFLVKELAEKERAWDISKGALDAQIDQIKRDTSKKDQDQQLQITHLEKQNAEVRAHWMAVRESLQQLEKERQTEVAALETKEKALRLEMIEKEQAWKSAQDALQDKLTAQQEAAQHESTTFQSRITELEKLGTAAESTIATLREKVQGLDKERATLSMSLQTRERGLVLQLEEKERDWTGLKQALDEKIINLTREAAQSHDAQHGVIVQLEARQREATEQIASLQEKLASLGAERDKLAETLRLREETLRKELAAQETAGAKAREDLQYQLSELKKASTHEISGQQARIAELEKQSADTAKYILSLKDKLQGLDKERTTLSLSLQNREHDLQQQMEEKTRAWTIAREALEEKLAALTRESTQSHTAQQDSISDLEARQKEAAAQIRLFQDKLGAVEKERDTVSETLRIREAALLKELEELEKSLSAAKGVVESQFAIFKKEAQQKSFAQQSRITDLEKLVAAAGSEMELLRGKLTGVLTERDALSESTRTRENALRAELKDREASWNKTQRELQDQLAAVSSEIVREKDDKQTRLTDFAKRHAESQALVQTLQDKLQALDAERRALTETLRSREVLLREEIERKQREGGETKKSLQAQIEAMALETARRNAGQNDQIAALEKRSADAERQVVELHAKLQGVVKERADLEKDSGSREAALHAELEQKERAYRTDLTEKQDAWKLAKEALETQIAAFKRDTLQKETGQQTKISELEKRSADAESVIQSLKEKLNYIEKERANVSLTLQTREQELLQQLGDSERQGIAAKEALEQKINAITREAGQKQQAQQAMIAELEARQKESTEQISALQEKLAAVAQQRDATSETLLTRETALRKELKDKEQIWTTAKTALEEQLAAEKKAAQQDGTIQRSRIADLEKRTAEAERTIQIQREKLQGLDKERASLTISLQTREQELQQQLDEKERVWTAAKLALEEKISGLSLNATQTQKAQHAAILELEARQKEALEQIGSLQEKLAGVEKERDTVSDTLRSREALLRKELKDKEQDWTSARTALESQLASQTNVSHQESVSQRSRIAEFEKRTAEAENTILSLRSKLQTLDKERTSVTLSLQAREQDLQHQLGEKEREWSAAKQILEEKFAVLSRDSTQAQKAQHALIVELEARQKESAAQVLALTEKLAEVEKERDSVSETLRNREMMLRKELEETERLGSSTSSALQTELAALKQESAHQNKTQLAMIKDLEKRSAQAAAEVVSLREKLQAVETDRKKLADEALIRETTLRRTLDDKAQEGEALRQSLEDRLISLKEENARKAAAQQTLIIALEKRSAEAETQVETLRERLQDLERERTTQTEDWGRRENALQAKLMEKERIWTTSQEALQEKLATHQQGASHITEKQQAEITLLEKQSAEARAQVQSLRDELHTMDQERRRATDALELREKTYAAELSDREQAWAQSKDVLETQLAVLKSESQQRNAAQQSRIHDLEKFGAGMEAELQSLREKIQSVENERGVVSESSRTREKALRSELKEKEQMWERTQRDLQDRLTASAGESARQREAQQTRILELEQKQALALTQVQTLQEKLQALELERQGLAQTLRTREASLREELGTKEHGWTKTQAELQEQLASLKEESAHQNKTQQALIKELEKRSVQFTSEIESLRDKLHTVESDRKHLAETSHAHEFELKTALEEKQREWTAAKQAFETQIHSLKEEATRKQAAQQILVGTLEKRSSEAEGEVASLRDRLRSLGEERTALEKTLRSREASLREELAEKERSSMASQEALEEKLAVLQQEASRKDEKQQIEIAQLEKQHNESREQVQVLRDQLHQLEKDHGRVVDTLDAKEKTYRTDLTDKEEAWVSARESLEAQLASLKKDSHQKNASQQTRIAELEKISAAAAVDIDALKEKLRAVQTERDVVSESARTSEKALRSELKEKEQAWERVRQDLQERLSTTSEESIRVREEHQLRMTELEQRSAQSQTLVQALRDKLQEVERERQTLAETLRTRETALRGELGDKGRLWEAAQEALQQQLASFKDETAHQSKAQQTLIKDLEKRSAQLASEAESLREKLHDVEADRKKISETLQVRELTLRGDLEKQQKEWETAKTDLEERLESLQSETGRTTAAQKDLIATLEKRSADAERQVKELKEKLHSVSSDRDALSDTLQQREAALRKELGEKERAWERTRNELQEQLSTLSVESVRDREDRETRIAELSRKYTQAQSMLQSLQQKLSDLDIERQNLSATLSNRETALREELDEKQRSWKSANQSLKEQLSHFQGDASQQAEAHSFRISELEKQCAAAEAQVEGFREKLRHLNHEREALSETLGARERVAMRDLEAKQKEWEVAREELQVQLTRIKKDAAQKNEIQQSRLSELERQNVESSAIVQTLQERIRVLEKERDSLIHDLHQREIDVDKRRSSLEQAMKRREQELTERTHRIEEDLRKAWMDKEQEISQRLQTSFDQEQSQFRSKIRQVQESSEDQLSKLRDEILKQEENLSLRKREMELREVEQAATFEGRERKVRELEDRIREEARQQLTQLDKEKIDWDNRIRQLQADQDDLQRRQSQVQSQESELTRLRDQLTSSLDSPSGRTPAGGVQSMIEEWVFGFAHQVRNPLGIIRSMAESMMNAKLPARAKQESFTAILQAVDGLARRLGEFIDFSKPVKASFCDTALSDVSDRALNNVRDRASDQKVDIRTRYTEAAPRLSLDPDQLQTALQHLLDNALEAMPQGGTLTVEIRPDVGGAVLRIIDSGAGFSAAHSKEIGKPFFTTKPGHVGLGLAGAKRILHVMGGELTFESKPGQGTTVSCRFKSRGK